MTYSTEFELDDRVVDLAWRAFRSQRVRALARQFAGGVLLLGVAGAILLPLGGEWFYVGSGVLVVAVSFSIWLVAMLGLGAYKAKISAFEHVKRLPSRHVHYEFNDDGVLQRTALSQTQVAWAGFKELRRTPEVWLLFVAKHRYGILPTQALSADLQRYITQKCAENGIQLS